jgi:hypothetical protein
VSVQTPAPFEVRDASHSAAVSADAVLKSALRFMEWLERYGETSWDFQTFYASDLTRSAKAFYYRSKFGGSIAVAPIIFCEAFAPWTRRFFFARQRFPIADAHYAMGFAFLTQALNRELYYQRAVHFLEVLKTTRCPGYKHYCWGYPFNWETIRGTIKAGTPLITTVPYVYEAFRQVWEVDRKPEWLEILRSIAQHALEDYQDIETSPRASTCSYTPDPKQSVGVVNANAYRAFLLMSAARDFSDERFRKAAQRNLNFVLECQNPDGSWFYANDGRRFFIDHFHTCFVLKALAKIEKISGDPDCTRAMERGVNYYVENLFDEGGAPKPFSLRPRLTVYRRELYDYAECLSLAILLQSRFPRLDKLSSLVVNEVLTDWQRADGSFRSRRLLLGWDNVPMHRWAQSQLFRSLCYLLYRNTGTATTTAQADFIDSAERPNLPASQAHCSGQ